MYILMFVFITTSYTYNTFRNRKVSKELHFTRSPISESVKYLQESQQNQISLGKEAASCRHQYHPSSVNPLPHFPSGVSLSPLSRVYSSLPALFHTRKQMSGLGGSAHAAHGRAWPSLPLRSPASRVLYRRQRHSLEQEQTL